VQILRKIGEFREITTKHAHRSEEHSLDADLLRSWTHLQNGIADINQYGAATIIVNPSTFVKTVYAVAIKNRREMFSGGGQNDMSEFLLFLVDSIHSVIKRPVKIKINGTPQSSTDNLAVQCYRTIQNIYEKEYSEIIELFYGISVMQIRKKDDTVLSTKPEHFFILDLIINRSKSIYDCLDSYCADETLENENAWYNETTKQKELSVKKRTIFWSFPKILVITLNRYATGFRKNGALIEFPIDNLDLSKYTRGYRPGDNVYDLFGVCNHYGGVSGGHYTAFSREIGGSSKSNGNWMEYNDTRVSEINNVVTPAAYCLFYRRRPE
jgi:ubiquitin C-terminal hydrolase